MLTYVYLIGGFIVLTLGAEALVRGASALALKLGVAPLIIGLTIVAFGTSAPELAVSIKAALANNSGIALGNVVGSNIANIGLILGLAALIHPMHVQVEMTKVHVPIMIAVSGLLWFLLADGALGVIDGLIFLALLAAYLIYSYFYSHNPEEDEAHEFPHQHVAVSAAFIIAGLAMLVGGGSFFVEGAVQLAKSLGVSDVVIGLTIVAVGTSMPELVTSVVAAMKKESDIAIGNVVGSNIFNILGILGVAALIAPISADNFNITDFIAMIAFAVILLPMCFNKHIGRIEGAVLVIAYIGYVAHLVANATA